MQLTHNPITFGIVTQRYRKFILQNTRKNSSARVAKGDSFTSAAGSAVDSSSRDDDGGDGDYGAAAAAAAVAVVVVAVGGGCDAADSDADCDRVDDEPSGTSIFASKCVGRRHYTARTAMGLSCC
jgi:hypothetical protein